MKQRLCKVREHSSWLRRSLTAASSFVTRRPLLGEAEMLLPLLLLSACLRLKPLQASTFSYMKHRLSALQSVFLRLQIPLLDWLFVGGNDTARPTSGS